MSMATILAPVLGDGAEVSLDIMVSGRKTERGNYVPHCGGLTTTTITVLEISIFNFSGTIECI